MRTTNGLYAHLIDESYLLDCARLAVKGKRRAPSVAQFLFRRESEILSLADRLKAKTWEPAGWSPRPVLDPKPRLIAVAPVIDRVLHLAVTRLAEPVFMRSVSDDVFACRKGKGTHRATLRILQLQRRHRWFLHLDIRAYFPSVVPETLLRLLAERIHDSDFLTILSRIIEAGRGFYDGFVERKWARLPRDWPPKDRGLPIGALTSQFFANVVYLLAFDHWVKRTLLVPGYVRYVDDLLLFGDSEKEMLAYREAAAAWLWAERGLLLKRPEARPRTCVGTIHALGHAISRSSIRARPRAWRGLTAAVKNEIWGRGVRHEQDDNHLRSMLAARVGNLLFL